MPTGYTAGILDGKITTFPQFAKQCMRNFGAVMHMRDDDFYAEYTPRIPGDYHSKAIETYKIELQKAQLMTDEEIINTEKQRLSKDRIYHSSKISEIKEQREKLIFFLNKAREFTPPTPEHEGIKRFMIDQLESTIDMDGNDKYHIKSLNQINTIKINASKIREDIIESAKASLIYHTEQNNSEIIRCNDSNKWVTDFITHLSNNE